MDARLSALLDTCEVGLMPRVVDPSHHRLRVVSAGAAGDDVGDE
jgi:hypothetical protein